MTWYPTILSYILPFAEQSSSLEEAESQKISIFKRENDNNSNITYLFSHGIADTHKQAYHYVRDYSKDKRYIIDGPLVTFNYPDANETNRFWIKRKEAGLAQDNEIACLAHVYSKTVEQIKKRGKKPEIILIGVSRGASTIINFMALNNPPEVKVLVLESPFDNISTIITNLTRKFRLDWLPGSKWLINNISGLIFRKYSKNGIQPIDSVGKLPKDLPIIIICSKEDRLVPAESSIRLYQELIKTDHTNAHLLVINSGKHAYLLRGDDGELYQNVVHAFYKKYMLPYNPNCARSGDNFLEKYQDST